MEVLEIKRLSDYIDFIEDLPSDFILSRGQNDKFDLLPSALREDCRGNRQFSKRSISSFLEDFKINSHNYMPFPWDVENDYEWMIYAQHYGIPTRLLDVTTSHILSLMFAVESSFIETEESDVAVWFLSPCKLNLEFFNRNEIITITKNSNEELKLDNADGPVVIQGRKLNERINIQKGMFIYFQESSKPLNLLAKNNDYLKKIIIKSEHKKNILTSLNSMGIGYTQIYPELSSVAKDILTKHNIDMYKKERD